MIAEELLACFFPEPPEPEQPVRSQESSLPQLVVEDVREDEVEDALLDISQDKAPGVDGLITRVWRELWPVLKGQICRLFRLSLRQGKLAPQWKIAKIIPFKKGGKDDYTQAKSYRPISLLSTLGKLLEAVVARRIVYLTEVYGLLPNNHFGARKQRSTVHALSSLQEQIYNAWRAKKTLSLVSFDVKGAYNNVARDPLVERLRQRRVPEQLVKWIVDFCTDRRACLLVNGYTSDVYTLPQSGLPQGSPLEPIFFLSFNADLVQSKIRDGGSMAFVDDYSAWVIGESAEANTRDIQRDILPRLERWERESSVVFEASKTAFIHFTRNYAVPRDSDRALHFKGNSIVPTESVKMLGVIMDQGLRFREHIVNKAAKAFKAALALKRLKGLRPMVSRQLINATVAPMMDYASFIWSFTASEITIQHLYRAQRVGAQAVVGGFRSMAMVVAEAEAGLMSIRDRLRRQCLGFWVNIHKLETQHPHAKLARVARKRKSKRFMSPLGIAAALFRDIRAERVETISTIACEPWSYKPHICIEEKESAKLRAIPRFGNIDIFTDSSVRNGTAGIGVWNKGFEMTRTLAWANETTVHRMELEAIWTAQHEVKDARQTLFNTRIFSDSKAALHSILRPRVNDSLGIVKRIREEVSRTECMLYWVPGHEGVHGNEKAHALAQNATEMTASLPTRAAKMPLSAVLREVEARVQVLEESPLHRSKNGKFVKKVDRALPGRHTRSMYNRLDRTDAVILSQLRTGIARLNGYLHRISASETADCRCGIYESVAHFLFACPRWKEYRTDIKRVHGRRYGDLSFALGGYTTFKERGRLIDGERSRWKPNLEAVKATIAFADATRHLRLKQAEEAIGEE